MTREVKPAETRSRPSAGADYAAPRLLVLGRLSDLTAGGAESGAEGKGVGNADKRD